MLLEVQLRRGAEGPGAFALAIRVQATLQHFGAGAVEHAQERCFTQQACRERRLGRQLQDHAPGGNAAHEMEAPVAVVGGQLAERGASVGRAQQAVAALPGGVVGRGIGGCPLLQRQGQRAQAAKGAANDAHWQGSHGMLRAADSGAALRQLATDDGYWRLHFLDGGAAGRVILQLAPEAPFAARLLREAALLRVLDGAGAEVLQGRLDADGECECAWPFAEAPAAHFQRHGAAFSVLPAQ